MRANASIVIMKNIRTRPDVAIVGAGFCGCVLAQLLARAGLKVLIIDRRAEFPDHFRAEKIEPDQAALLESIGLLDLRRPLAGPVGVVSRYDGGDVERYDTVEQYGISYADSVNAPRESLPSGVTQVTARVSEVKASHNGPVIFLSDGTAISAGLVAVTAGGSSTLGQSLGIRRATIPDLVSLSYSCADQTWAMWLTVIRVAPLVESGEDSSF